MSSDVITSPNAAWAAIAPWAESAEYASELAATTARSPPSRTSTAICAGPRLHGFGGIEFGTHDSVPAPTSQLLATMKRPIPVIALDVPSAAEAFALMDRLGSAADFVKVGLQLFTAEGP